MLEGSTGPGRDKPGVELISSEQPPWGETAPQSVLAEGVAEIQDFRGSTAGTEWFIMCLISRVVLTGKLLPSTVLVVSCENWD